MAKVLLYNTEGSFTTLDELKQQLAGFDAQIFRLVRAQDKERPQAYLIPPGTQLTCATAQIINQQAAHVNSQLASARTIFNKALLDYNTLTGLREHRNATVALLEKARRQLEAYANILFSRISHPIKQKILCDSEEPAQKQRRKYAFQLSMTSDLLAQEEETMNALKTEIEEIQECFNRLSLARTDE